MKDFLYDVNFLRELDYHREKDSYARITLLTIDDYPKEYIEGTITGGSVNIDGASSIRRSCSLNLLVTNEDINNNNSYINDKYWSYNNKFKLEIGIKNLINSKYPEILWFDQGIYIISNFNITTGVDNITVTIQGKDKMCRLNGEISGNIPIETDFGTIETIQEDGISLIEKLSLKTIIFQAVKEYANERAENIIINDLDDIAYELWEYRGESPMYLIIDENKKIRNISFDGKNTKIAIKENEDLISFEDFGTNNQYYSFNTLDKTYNDKATSFKMYGTKCYLAKIEYGETAGYHITPLVYNDDLILKAGETVTALLDKIKNMLGNYEYFYDLYGRFVFQKKNTYINEIFSPINGDIIIPSMHTSPYSYQFTDYKLISNISSPPNIGNTKNDFTIWGVRKTVSGTELPIHARYAIGKKPTEYKSYDGVSFSTTGDKAYDWRELIYRMAQDYYKHNTESNFLLEIQNNNSWCKQGVTGYEQYYSDFIKFWRQLYNPDAIPDEEENEFYGEQGSDGEGKNKYWNKKIHTDPNSLNFWFDFLDVQGDISNYNIEKIGVRTKVINENSIKSIYFKETPEILFLIDNKDNKPDNQNAYSIIYIQENLQDFFARSSQGLSAISRANDLIYQHTMGTETLSITSIPIYYLEPNTRIYIEGYGDYILDKISYSLNYNSMMNISGTKINKQFY